MMVHDDLLPRCLPPDFRRDVKRHGGQAGEGWGMGIGSEKKLENGFERFHRGSRTNGGGGGGGGSGDGEPSENSVPAWLSEGKQYAGSEESRDFTRTSRITPRIARPAFNTQ